MSEGRAPGLSVGRLGSAEFERLSRALDDLLELDGAERASRRAAIGAGDPELAAELEALLAAEASGGPLARSATELAAPLFADESGGTERAGERVGPFRLGDLIGRGGMGAVYAAERVDGGFAQAVAVKVVKRGLDSEEVLARFAVERRILARLEHPHIARVVDGGMTADGLPWFAMERIEGQPITDYSAERRLPVAERLRLFLEVADAVAFAHRNLVVHRDLKPSNVLVDAEARVRLLDFGIAKLLSGDGADESLTRTAMAAPMTPQYAAPEQRAGGPVSTLTDVYQLGRLLSGLLAAGDGAVPRDLERIAARAAHDDPVRRYPGVEALADDVRRFLDGRPIAARADTLAYRTGRFVSRHRLGVAAGGAVVAALVVGLVLALAARNREAAAARRASATRDFLVRLFEEASPERNGGETPTVAEVLAEGTRRVESELAAEPRLRADLLATLARLHMELGDFARGLDLAGREAELAETLFERDSAARVESLALLGEALHRSERHAEALERLDTARELAVRLEGPDGLAVARVDVLRTAALWRLGRAPEGEKAAVAALTVFERRLGRDADEAAGALADLVSVVYAQSDFHRAYELSQDLLARRRRALDPRHPAIARALHDLAVSAQELDLNDEALAAYGEAVAIHTAAAGPDHARTLETRKALGSLLEVLGRFDEAEAELVATAGGWLRRYGAASYGYGDALNMLSIVRYRRGRYREAAESFELVAANFRERFGPENPSTLSVQNNLGATLTEAGELDRAEPVLVATLAARRRVAPRGDWLSSLNFLGRVARERGRFDEAERLHRESIEIATETHGADNSWTTTARFQLGLDLAARGSGAAATAELEAALALDRRNRPATHPRLADELVALAELDLAAGRKARAAERAREAVEIRRASLGADDPRTAAAERLLARID